MVALELWEPVPGITRFVEHDRAPQVGGPLTIGSIRYLVHQVDQLPAGFDSDLRVVVSR